MKECHYSYRVGIYLFCIILAFIFLLLFSQTLSPLYSIEGCDSSVFKLMGLAILRGKVPYVDIFDHKGPLLYFIQAIGQLLIPGRIGLFVLAVVSLSISLICWYKSSRFWMSPLKSFFVTIMTLCTYYLYYEGGNLTEDWSITFISISLYLIVSLFFHDEANHHLIKGCCIGLCLAGSFFIRPNDAVAFIVAPIAGILVWLLKCKKNAEAIQLVCGVIIGYACIAIIFVMWFAYHHALMDFWYGLIGYNAKYSTGFNGLIRGCVGNIKLGYLPFLITLITLCWQFNDKRIVYLVLPTALLGYILLGNNAYTHYWIAWIPILFLSYWVVTITQKNIAIVVLSVCIFLSLPIFNEKNWLKMPIGIYNEVKNNIHYRDHIAIDSKELFEVIENVDRDSIWSYNLTWYGRHELYELNAFNVLLYNNIIPCNRVPLIFMANFVKDDVLFESMNITNHTPKYILFSKQHSVPDSYSQRDSAFIENRYIIVKGTDSNPHISLYKRKESN